MHSDITALHGGFMLGPWLVRPRRCCLERGDEVVHIELKAMEVLVYLATHTARPVSRDELLEAVWRGSVVTDEVVTRVISVLRRALDDDFRSPAYIETVPKVGYRLIPPALPLPEIQGVPVLESPPYAGWVRSRGRAGVIVLVIFAAVMLLSFFYRANVTPAPPQAHTRAVPLTTLPGMEFDPALSPDGREVAFVRQDPGEPDRFDIYVKGRDTDALRRLTRGGNDFGPAWSPDGRHLAFIRFGEAGCRIMTIPAGGTTEMALAPCGGNLMADLAWSPDGHTLLFSDRATASSPFGLMQVSVATGAVAPLAEPADGTWGDTDPAFSPDGRHVAFIRSLNTAMQDIYTLSMKDGTVRRHTYRNEVVDGLAWAPDGRHILFATGNEQGNTLWRIALAEGSSEQPYPLNPGMRNPSVAPGGVAGERWIQDINVWRLPLTEAVLPAASPQPLITSTRRDRSPHVSPEGSRLVFTSDRSGTEEVWVKELDASEEARLTGLRAASVGLPRWSPEGARIVFEAHVDGNADLYLTDPGGSLPRRLTTHPALDLAPRWSRDGRWIYFASRRSGAWQTWKLPAEGGEPVQVTRSGGMTAQESADGWLYYARSDRDGLWRMPAEGGPPEPVVDRLSSRDWRRWTLTDRGILFRDRDGTASSIAYFSFASGAVTTLVDGAYILDVDIAPDGRTLYYSQIDRQESDLVFLEEGW